MPTAPTKMERCPRCSVEFIGSAYASASGNFVKRCPNGHEVSLYRLARARKAEAMEQTPPPVESAAGGQRRLELTEALGVMLAAYEQVERTLPPSLVVRGLVAGAFERPVVMARKVLGIEP